MEIFEAAKAGKESEVGRLLCDISLPEVKKRYQHTALEVAAQHGQVGVMRLLIRRMTGANGVAGHHEGVALHLAAKHGQEAVVDILCDSGADLDSTALGDRTPLIWASSQGHVGVVQRLLYYMGDEGIDGKGECYKQLTALHYAAANGHEEVVKLLLQRGADATITSVWDMTPLSSACAGGHLGVAQLLLDHQGVQALGMTARTRSTPLQYAARGGREDLVKLLLGKGADANIARANGWTPFMEAASHGHVGVARVLLEHMGVQDVDTRDSYGRTALHYAAVSGHEDMVTFLLSKGASAISQCQEGLTPLTASLMQRKVGVARLLLEQMGEEDMDTRQDQQRSALHYAAGDGHEDMVVFLLRKGANAIIQDENGNTPFMEASIEGHVGIARVLLEHMGGQGVDTRNSEVRTALHHAARRGHEDMVAFLLSKGADATIQDDEGLTPFMEASRSGHTEVAQLLLEHMGGQGLDTTDNAGMTALRHAATCGHTEMVSFLLDKGADPNTTALDGSTALACPCHDSQWPVMLLLAKHVGRQGRERRDSEGRTPFYLACVGNHWKWARLLLLAGADHTTTDNQGHRPPGFDEDLLPWWEGELERPYLLHRARSFQDAASGLPHAPRLPAFFEARLAAATPRVEIASTAHEKGATARVQGMRSPATQQPREPWSVPRVGEKERHAMVEYSVTGLNDQLFADLLQGFH